MTRGAHRHGARSTRPNGDVPPKVCATCGRTIEWRAAWARDWAEVRYCSDGCRRHRPGPLDRALEEQILALIDSRAAGATICPSEVARHVAASLDRMQTATADPDGGDWRRLMEPTRRAARRLVAAGEVEITQQGRVVDPSTARGPIRIRRRRP